ncbi:hypothetical protein [Alloactinosynnema sp. L-07]|uniref:hypothetical protein n=1 Tax=Alloactinosynnema sp. L-07 TaxID=1653480 RepID=UPI00065EEF6A|nr:hypothetical protein [Alloactinosynnema sp. L-07]CRK56803.1 hypothetical protein [Alloactinosynnema sp. L-07]
MRSSALLHYVSQPSTQQQQLAKELTRGLAALLKDGLAGLEALSTLSVKAIHVDGLRDIRQPAQLELDPRDHVTNLLERTRLTGMTDTRARAILASPQAWPPLLMRTADRRLTPKTAASRPPLVDLASSKNWFPDVRWRY